MMELLGAVATVAVGILAAVQWNISRKTDKRNREVDERYRKAEQDARERERDTEMTRWGGEVIDVMAEIETACAPLSTENKPSIKEIETLSQTASALVDRGRMFFRC